MSRASKFRQKKVVVKGGQGFTENGGEVVANAFEKTFRREIVI